MAFSLIVWRNLEFPLVLSGWNWTSLALKRWFERGKYPKTPYMRRFLAMLIWWTTYASDVTWMILGCYLDVTWMVLLHLPIFPVKHTPPDSLQQRHCSKPHSSEEPLKDGPWKHGVFFASFLSNVHNSYAIPWYWLLYRDPDAGLLFPIYSLAFIVYQVTIIFFGKTLIKILKLVPFWLFSPSSRFSRMHTAKPSELTFK